MPSAASGAALSLVRCANEADSDAVTLIQRFESAATRPALTNERAQFDAVGQVVLKLNTPWRDGIMRLVMSPPELMQRLAALVPEPRLRPSTGCARGALRQRPVCGEQFEAVNVWRGSKRNARRSLLRLLRMARSKIVPTFALIKIARGGANSLTLLFALP